MCRLSSELLATAGGSGIIATITTFAKYHWDAIRDRKAFKKAKMVQSETASEDDN